MGVDRKMDEKTGTLRKQRGRASVVFENPPLIMAAASTVGKKEGDGPLGVFFDRVELDPMLGKKNWEEAESELQSRTAGLVIEKSGLCDKSLVRIHLKQLFLNLHADAGAALLILFLMLKLRISAIIILEIRRRNSANGVETIEREAVVLYVRHNFCRETLSEHIVDKLLAVLLDGGYPAQVIKTDICNIAVVTHSLFRIVDHVDRDIAKTHALDIGVVEHELGDDAGGIGEVDEPCVGADSLDAVADMLHDRDSTQSLEEAADAGGLLTDEVIFERDSLIEITGMKHADSYLGDNKVCALKSLVKVIGEKSLALYARLLEHSQAEVADYRSLPLVYIHKGYLLELERGLSLYESVHKLGAICAARTDDCYCNFFHIYYSLFCKILIYTA